MPLRGPILSKNPSRLPALALLFASTAGVRVATAQTVIVRSAPAAATIELAVDGGRTVTATADRFGDVTLTAPSQGAEIEAQLYVDSCGSLVRVLLARLRPGAPQAGCIRTEIGSVFLVRPITTFVIDMTGTRASAHVTQGPPPRDWIERGEGGEPRARREWGTPQTGLALSGGAGFSTFSKAVNLSCGNVAVCDSGNFGVAFAGSADYWFLRAVAAHAGYLRPADVTTAGSGSSYRFDSRLQTRLLIVGAKVGGPVGPLRLYGLAGFNRHEATATTTQTIDSSTVTVGGVTQTIPGGTQTFAQQTNVWNWVFGGGMEAWVNRWIAFYVDVTVPKIKGKPITGGEGGIDDRAFIVIGGARVHIGR